MKKPSLLLSLLLLFRIAFAHDPDLSSTMIIEHAPKQWALQIKADMTSFEFEIENSFGKEAYPSPEEFPALVLKHVQENVSLRWNEQAITLQNGEVILGHETAVIFNLINVPEELGLISITNKTFKNIHNNQSAVELVKKGLPPKKFLLTAANQHSIDLKFDSSKNSFVDVSPSNPFTFRNIGLAIGFIMLIAATLLLIFSRKK